jgi:hypothetical protein
LALDDSFHFGDGSAVGRYAIEVEVFNSITEKHLTTLRSCVFYRSSRGSNEDCLTFLRSLKRINSEQWMTFDGNFSAGNRYTVIFLSNGRVSKYIDAGVYVNSTNELNLTSDKLIGAAGRTYDILAHDHDRNVSSTLGRVTIPAAQ